MAKQQVKKPPPPRPRTRWAVLGVLGLIAAAAALLWWFSGGTPRLVLDRDTVDLGYLPFETPARVVFSLTNTGDGVLRIDGVPRVKVLKGC